MRVIVSGIPHNPKTTDTPVSALFETPADVAGASNRCEAGDEAQFIRLYETNCDLLVALSIRKFQVPAVDAEALAHEVFLSYLKRKDEIRDVQKWLIGAICHASRYYWRQHGRNIEQLDMEVAAERPDPVSMNVLDTLPARIAAGEALAGLPPRYQQILRLRYFEGYSIKEIAEHLGVTAKYAAKLVAKSLRRAEEVFNPSEAGEKK